MILWMAINAVTVSYSPQNHHSTGRMWCRRPEAEYPLKPVAPVAAAGTPDIEQQDA